MVQRRMPGCNPKGRDHRPHHISSIAHHFFDEEDGVETNSGLIQRELIVCSAANGPLSAWACAGLARSLATEATLLGESSWLAWSASSYLQSTDLTQLDHGDILVQEFGGPVEDQSFWQIMVPGSGAATTSLSTAVPRNRRRVMLRNLGTLNNHQLGELEAVHLLGNSSGVSLPGGDALVWCLTPEDALSLGAAYTLGRALALLKPKHVEILIVDESCLNPALSPCIRSSADLIKRCRHLSEAVARERPVFLIHAQAEPNRESRSVSQVFKLIAERVLDPVCNSD